VSGTELRKVEDMGRFEKKADLASNGDSVVVGDLRSV